MPKAQEAARALYYVSLCKDHVFAYIALISDYLNPPLLFRYLNAIQTMCPHILRYLTTAVITNKDVRKRRQVLKDLVKVIQQVRAWLHGDAILFNSTYFKKTKVVNRGAQIAVFSSIVDL